MDVVHGLEASPSLSRQQSPSGTGTHSRGSFHSQKTKAMEIAEAIGCVPRRMSFHAMDGDNHENNHPGWLLGIRHLASQIPCENAP